MAISEIGVAFPDETFGNMSRFGVPFTFLLRDILQFDEVRACNGSLCFCEKEARSQHVLQLQSLEAAKARITDAHRTCDLILGVGDGKVLICATRLQFAVRCSTGRIM